MMSVDRAAQGKLILRIPEAEAAFLFVVPARLRDLLTAPDFTRRSVVRLFPRAYSDPDKEREYRQLLGDDLRCRKLEGVRVFEEILDGAVRKAGQVTIAIEPERFDLWLGAINDLRLALGADLEIAEDGWTSDFDPHHPRAADLALLHYLSWLEEALLAA